MGEPLPTDENSNVPSGYFLPGIRAHRNAQRIVVPKHAAIHAASSLLNLADHPANRQRMLAAGVPQLVTEVLTSRTPNVLVERCQLLANWMNIGSIQALEKAAARCVGWGATSNRSVPVPLPALTYLHSVTPPLHLV